MLLPMERRVEMSAAVNREPPGKTFSLEIWGSLPTSYKFLPGDVKFQMGSIFFFITKFNRMED